MIIVSNTTPLIGLAVIGHFELLPQLFGEIHIAQAVHDEAVIAGREEGGVKREVSATDWIHVVRVQIARSERKDEKAEEEKTKEKKRGR